MYSLFETTTSLMPTTTAYGSTNFTLTDDGNIDKQHLVTTIATSGAITSSNIYQNYKYEAVLRKYANAREAESYIESLSDEELELALQKIGALQESLNEPSPTKRV